MEKIDLPYTVEGGLFVSQLIEQLEKENNKMANKNKITLEVNLDDEFYEEIAARILHKMDPTTQTLTIMPAGGNKKDGALKQEILDYIGEYLKEPGRRRMNTQERELINGIKKILDEHER